MRSFARTGPALLVCFLVGPPGCGGSGQGSPDLRITPPDFSLVGELPDLGQGADLADLAPAPRTCGFPGDTGNPLGVGKYCTGNADCASTPMAHICSAISNPATSFCTLLCTVGQSPNPCGQGATCNGQEGLPACVPDLCLQDD